MRKKWKEIRLRDQCRDLSFYKALVLFVLFIASLPSAAQQTRTVFPAADATVTSAKTQPTHGIRARVTLTVKDSSIKYIVNELVRQARLQRIFDDNAVLSKRTSVNLNNVPIMEALAIVLRGTKYTADVAPDGETVMIHAQPVPPRRATLGGTVMGQVVDSATGKGLSGVVIKVAGTKITTTTVDSGHFVLRNLPSGDYVLTVKRFGYRPLERSVTVADSQDTKNIRITMTVMPNLLSGVVTTATGQQQKLEVGNSIVSLNVDSIMQTAPIRSVVDILEGRVPGMTVQRTSGTPGDPARIRLRGTGSILQNNDPILVVDGIRMYGEQSNERNANVRVGTTDTARYATPSPLDQMDPNMIEKIEVLKGPSAASLYGSDAANGVIVITTKKGKSGGTQWSVASDQGLSYIPGSWPTVLWPWGKGAVSDAPVNCAPGEGQGGLGCSIIDSIVSFQALNEPRYTVAGRGYSSGVTTSLLGGRGAMQYAYTASTRNELGLLKLPVYEQEVYQQLFGERAPGWMRRPEQLKSWSLSATNSMQLNDNTHVSITTLLNNSVQRRTGLSDSFNSAVAQLSRTWIDTTQYSTGYLIGNPYEQATSDQTNVTLGAQAQWQALRRLPLMGTVGVNILTRADEIFLGAKHDPLFFRQGIEPAGHLQATDGRALNQTATVNTTIPLMTRLALALGINYQNQQINDAVGYFEGFGKEVTNPSSGTLQDRLQYTRNATDRKSFGWFIEPQLSFESRFFIMPGIRLDNNGLSGKNAGLNSLPKMNLSWIASEEPLFPFKNVVDLFRVRTAFGVAGVQPDAQDRFRLLQEVNVSTNANDAKYYGDMLKLTGLGNTRLRPERSGEIEGGFDSELLDGRVKMDVTLYRKIRYDAIVGLPLASSIGSGEVKINLGIVRNQGSELGFDVQLLERRSLGLNVGLNLSTNSNEVVKLNGTDQSLGLLQGGGSSVFTQHYRVGYPMNGAWTTPIQSYHDLDGDGLLSPSEVLVGDSAVFMGSKEPTRTAGIRSDLTMLGGRISVHTNFNYTGGLTQTDGVSASCIDGYLSGCSTTLALARYSKTAPLDEQAAAVALAAYGSAYGIMRRVSSWRFQTASFNMNVGQSVARLVRARTMSIALQGSNLHLWTNYRGKDPNVNGYVWGNNTADLGQLPSPRTWALRVSLGN